MNEMRALLAGSLLLFSIALAFSLYVKTFLIVHEPVIYREKNRCLQFVAELHAKLSD